MSIILLLLGIGVVLNKGGFYKEAVSQFNKLITVRSCMVLSYINIYVIIHEVEMFEYMLKSIRNLLLIITAAFLYDNF